MRSLELLAPAKNLECGMAAISHGADAIYIGASRFGARAAAGNSVEDIKTLCDYAHQFGAKVYVTVNTIIYDNEIDDTRKLLRQLNEIGVDALLVQDMGILKLVEELKEKEGFKIELHASTQTDNRSAEKVRYLRELGFRRAVLARELSAEEISAIHKDVPDVELEVFVHGALCVSYSGVCYASQYCFNRSANRGECAQFCRMKFDLLDSEENEIEHQRYLLSLRDMCQIENLELLADSGACSFKIEGRLKDVDYVKNVVAAYSSQLNKIIKKHPKDYRRASFGSVEYTFEPNLKKTFNRGFTTYFLNGRQPDIASFDTPKAMGEYVGKVKELRSNSFNVAGTATFANGDGLCFINNEHELEGFRVNKAVGNRLFPFKMPEHLKPGTVLYRNNDVAFNKLLSGDTAERKIEIKMLFETVDGGFSLKIFNDDLNISAISTIVFEHQKANKPQHDNIVRQLGKLGNTVYQCSEIIISEGTDEFFIPSSLLSDLRRDAIDRLVGMNVANGNATHSLLNEVPIKENTFPSEYGKHPYLYNISNELARDFYEGVGLTKYQTAYELSPVRQPLIMQCRHCLRYTLGYCVKRGGQKPQWSEPLYLRLYDGRKFRLEFNCAECQMNIYAE
jgi:putative protease